MPADLFVQRKRAFIRAIEQKKLTSKSLADLVAPNEPKKEYNRITHLRSGQTKLTVEHAKRYAPHLKVAPGVLLAGSLTEEEAKTDTLESLGIATEAPEDNTIEGLMKERRRRLAEVFSAGNTPKKFAEDYLQPDERKGFVDRVSKMLTGSRKPTVTDCQRVEEARGLTAGAIVVRMTHAETRADERRRKSQKAAQSQPTAEPTADTHVQAGAAVPTGETTPLVCQLILGSVDFGEVKVDLTDVGQEVLLTIPALRPSAFQLLKLMRK
jgi:hypothetical protein